MPATLPESRPQAYMSYGSAHPDADRHRVPILRGSRQELSEKSKKDLGSIP
jgi:hypothetical protein